MAAVVFSVSPDYYRAAVAELRRSLPVATVRRVGPDAGLVELRGTPDPLAQVAAAVRAGDVRFVRHLAVADQQTKTSALPGGPEAVTEWAMAAVEDRLSPGDEVGLHVWDSGEPGYAPGKVRRPVLEALLDAGVRVATAGAPRTISICIGDERSTTGIGASEHGLVDWAGGRMRLAARKEQVSRAEFKLEELFALTDQPTGEIAVDLGASPGGWTRILRSIGFGQVHAVDPAELEPRVLADPGVRHHRTTAGEWLQEARGPVDLIVNDMRMVPHLTAVTMVDAADLLRPGGLAIITFKLGTNNPIKQADESLELLEPAYETSFVRQLQHNRQELTVVARRR